MRILKLGIISAVTFGLMITFISFFFPSHVRISKAINIGAPRDTILQFILKEGQWMPGYDTVGFWGAEPDMAIKDKNLLDRSKLVIKTDASGTGDFHITFTSDSRTNLTQGWHLLTELRPDSVTVQWYMDFKLHWYPWEKFSSLFFENRFGPQMEKGLTRLKELAEARRPSNK